MYRVSNLLILLVVLVIGIVFIYRLIYTHSINKRILSGEIQGRKMIDVSSMVMIAIIVGLTIYSVLLTYVVNDYANQNYLMPRNNYAVIDVSNPEEYKYAGYFGKVELEDASFAKVYSKEENAGYDKEVIASGEYLFTVFTRNTPADSFHPDFRCFVEYTGDKGTSRSCYNNAGFQAFDVKDYFSIGTAGDIRESLLYIGYLDVNYSFQITMALMDKDTEEKYIEAEKQAEKENKEETPKIEDFADSIGSVTIIVEEMQ